MCFSETSSFGLAAVLAPVGGYCLNVARQHDCRYLPLAAFPLAFAAQQATEGVVWHGINNDDPALAASAARGFVFFSHFFWLGFVPLSIAVLEIESWRRRALWLLTAVGTIYGATLFLPLILNPDWLVPTVFQGSIEYETTLIYDDVISAQVVRAIYSLIIVLALLLSSQRSIQVFGLIIVGSVLGAYWWFGHAFISVWCFFAAALSSYVAYVMHRVKAQRMIGE